MNGFKWFLGLCSVLMVFVLAAVAVNQQELTLSFALWQTPFALSMFWWLLAAFLLGLFFGALTLLCTGPSTFQKNAWTKMQPFSISTHPDTSELDFESKTN